MNSRPGDRPLFFIRKYLYSSAVLIVIVKGKGYNVDGYEAVAAKENRSFRQKEFAVILLWKCPLRTVSRTVSVVAVHHGWMDGWMDGC